jgi:parvulin-like peptidyl-prolyl isomerase
LHPTRTHRFLLSAASLLALLVGATACSSGPTVAATVGGTEISAADVDQAYARRAESPAMASELATESDVNPELQAAVLTTLIRTEILRQAAEDRGVEVSDEEISEQRNTLIESAGGQEALDQAMADNNVSDEELEENLRDQAIQAEISRDLASEVSDEQVRAAFTEDPQGQYGEKVEVRHILTETEEQAQEAIDRIESGEDFAQVAQEMSQDQGSAQQGGELGAVTRGSTVPEFDEAAFNAEEGELVGPVETEFGFHVLEVTGTVAASEFPAVEDDIRSQLETTAQGQAFNGYITRFIEGLEIEVDPAYGTWDGQSVSVIPPRASESPTSGGTPPPALPSELPTALPSGLPTALPTASPAPSP